MALTTWQQITDGSIPADQLGSNQYIESRETEDASLAPNSSSVTRTFFVNWNYRTFFLDDLLGYSTYTGGTTAAPLATITRDLPDQHPVYLTFYASDASVQGWGQPPSASGPSSSAAFKVAKIKATYRPVDYAVLADNQLDTITINSNVYPDETERFVTFQYAFQPEYLSLNGLMQWVGRSSNKLLGFPPGKIIGALQMTCVWHNVPADGKVNPYQPPNLGNIQSCLGKVNSVPFMPHGQNFPAGTVLFIGADPKMVLPKRSVSVSSAYEWEISLVFLIKQFSPANSYAALTAGHNWLYDSQQGTGVFDLVTSDGTVSGATIYSATDLNAIFTLNT